MTARAASRAEAPGVSAAARIEPQRGKTRRRQIDEIVEPRGGPAEGAVPLVLVADHAVGGVDRLVAGAADEPAERRPEDRRDDAVGKILRETLDRRPRDPRFVKRRRVAADDHRDRPASLWEAKIETVRHGPDMAREAPLRRQTRGEKRKRGEAEHAQRR